MTEIPEFFKNKGNNLKNNALKIVGCGGGGYILLNYIQPFLFNQFLEDDDQFEQVNDKITNLFDILIN